MSRPGISLSLASTPDPAARSVIGDGLDGYNVEQTGIADQQALDVLVADGGRVVGGLVGRTSLGVLFVDYFFLPAALRGRGVGASVLAMAEAEAVRRGCARALLFTMAIQAPAFYERRGYRAFGRIECDPPGNARIFMHKELR
jgi:GNAT superfamily N-acetyltransferase